MWFEKLTGFKEESPDQVREKLYIKDNELISTVNGNRFLFGSLETPSLSELRHKVKASGVVSGQMQLQECIGDIQELHTKEENNGAFFQVASQFNLLEMVSPEVSPDAGIDGYEYDQTQGPACAIAAGAGTIYRNYFVEVNNQIGQSKYNQIDTLADVGMMLGNNEANLWKMKNGYALASELGLKTITKKINSFNEIELDKLRESLRIGVQWNTEVTINNSKQLVTQAYCSALPVAYSQYPDRLWKSFSQLVLDASYEATICAAILNYTKTNNPNVYLTMLGGGAFGNDEAWILRALERALLKYQNVDLNVFVVSYHSSNFKVKELVDRLNGE